MAIGEQIKFYREKKGLTQEQLGELIGVKGATITRYEKNDRQPKLEIISKLATALDVSTGDIFNIKSEHPSPNSKFSILESFGLDKLSLAKKNLISSNFPHVLKLLETYGYELIFDIEKNAIFLSDNNKIFKLTNSFLHELDSTINFSLKVKLEEFKQKEGE